MVGIDNTLAVKCTKVILTTAACNIVSATIEIPRSSIRIGEILKLTIIRQSNNWLLWAT